VLQPVSTNKALAIKSRWYNRSVWIGGNANQPEMKSPEATSGNPITGLTIFQAATD
jgi:hypothetical protein